MKMSSKDCFNAGSLQVEELARLVIEGLGKKSPAESRKSVVETSVWLATITTTEGRYEHDDVLDALLRRGVSKELLIDFCIPDAARILGEGWMENLRSFGQVSVGAVRLQSLLKSMTLRWGDAPFKAEEEGIFLIVCPSDDHTLGPLVLADQLRRKGYSVNIMMGVSDETLIETAQSGSYELILFSCSCMVAFEDVKKVASMLKSKVLDLPTMVLGGPVIDLLEEDDQRQVEVDLITNEVDVALQSANRKKQTRHSIERAS
jgi:methanogenic corrinoid protein MtbC1